MSLVQFLVLFYWNVSDLIVFSSNTPLVITMLGLVVAEGPVSVGWCRGQAPAPCDSGQSPLTSGSGSATADTVWTSVVRPEWSREWDRDASIPTAVTLKSRYRCSDSVSVGTPSWRHSVSMLLKILISDTQIH